MNSRNRLLRLILTTYLAANLAMPSVILADPPHIPGFYGNTENNLPQILPNALPQHPDINPQVSGRQAVPDGSADLAYGPNRLDVYQNKGKIILDWSTFNIGKDAETQFHQDGGSALNRIYDQNPSQIYGKLTADGKIYLINQNGILFGQGAQVNVHTLAASALNMAEEDFQEGVMRFAAPEVITDEWLNETWVANRGTIKTTADGAVYMLAPNVENSGTVNVPFGIVNIAAGTDAAYKEEFTAQGTISTKTFTVNNPTGTVINVEGGRIQADSGDIRLVGRVVNTDGMIRSVQAINNQGTIELRAAESVHVGPASRIETPVDSSSQPVLSTESFLPGQISISSGKKVVLEGQISAPSGIVDVQVSGSADAPGRIYFEDGSSIDVGGLWVNKATKDQFIDVQLNSVELRDDYGQKNGSLRGQTITVSKKDGSAIGNVAQQLKAQEVTTAEKAVIGGDVRLSVDQGDIIIRDGAHIDFSGGGLRYGSGTAQTTKLVAGTKVFDISEAPQDLNYEIAGNYRKVNERYGQIEEYSGIYFGGATPVRDYVAAYDVGADAGSLFLVAPTVVLDGSLDGSVTVGTYQTAFGELLDAGGNPLTTGRTRPQGGDLVIGAPPQPTTFLTFDQIDPITAEILLSGNTQTLPESFGLETPLSLAFAESAGNPLQTDYYDDDRFFFRTILPVDTLNQSGLQSVTLHATTELHIDADARLFLQPRGSFIGTARRIIHQGQIRSPSGLVQLTSASNITVNANNDAYISPERLGPERVHLAASSIIDVSGERIDNNVATALNEPIMSGSLQGGTVELHDYAASGRGVVIESGALVDVSGGYQIAAGGAVQGGDGGSVDVDATAIVLDGTLFGHSLFGYDGSEVSLHAQTVAVASDDTVIQLPGGLTVDAPIPDNLLGKLTIGDAQLEMSGFTHIDLISRDTFIFEEDVVFTPSNSKLATPLSGSSQTGAGAFINNNTQTTDFSMAEDGIIILPDVEIGRTSIGLGTGVTLVSSQFDLIKEYANLAPGTDSTGEIYIPSNVSILAAPGGDVAIQAPSRIDVTGTIRADGGTISLTGANSIRLREGSILAARGYARIKDSAPVKGLSADVSVFDGGSIQLRAETLLQVDEGALIDVSAADTVQRVITTADDRVKSIALDGHAGSVLLEVIPSDEPEQGLIFNGGLLARHADRPGVGGGSLELVGRNTDLIIKGDWLSAILTDDIDNLALVNRDSAVVFEDAAFDLALNGSLLLDTNEIKMGGAAPADARIHLAADLVVIENSGNPFFVETPSDGSAILTVEGRQGIELNGQTAFSGFGSVSLASGGDLRVSDLEYTIDIQREIKGGLETRGSLTLAANRIYPTTLSLFTLRAGGQAGRIQLYGNGEADPAPIYSADGQLIFAAREILQDGVVKAPMGDIVFCGDFSETQPGGFIFEKADTIIFGDNAVTSTTGEAPVYYGSELREDNLAWKFTPRRLSTQRDVDSAPSGSLRIEADTYVAAPGAAIDASGGGEIYSYRWDPGIEGSVDPLLEDNRYIILPGSPATENGDGIFLSGSDLAVEGEYAFVSAEFAFAPGAVVIEDRGALGSFAQVNDLSEEGYRQVVGYFSQVGTDQQDTTPHVFTIRPAADVLKEGFFQTRQLTAGDGGTIQILSQTNLLEAQFDLSPLIGFSPGLLEATAGQIIIGNESTSVARDVIETGSIPNDLENKLVLNADGLLRNNQGNLRLGTTGETTSVTVDAGAGLVASSIELSARDCITLSSGASLEAGVTIGLTADNGYIDLQENTCLQASGGILLNANSIDFDGEIGIDNGDFTLVTNAAFWMTSDGFTAAPASGIVITQSQWEVFSEFQSVELNSRSGLFLDAGFDMNLQGSPDSAEPGAKLTIDSGLIAATGDISGSTSRISAGDGGYLSLINSGNNDEGLEATGSGNLLFEAGDIVIGAGDIRIDGFNTVDFHADGDIAFRGIGSLETQADVLLSAARVTTVQMPVKEDAEAASSQLPDFHLSSTVGSLSIEQVSNPEALETNVTTGGKIAFSAIDILVNGQIDIPGAALSLTSTGSSSSDSIHLMAGADLSAAGTAYASGGEIILHSESGGITVDQGAVISVAAGDQGDAGSLAFLAPRGFVSADGTLSVSGTAATVNGRGGTFILDARQIGELSDLAQELASGGFYHEIRIRSRLMEGDTGGLFLAAGNTIAAKHLKLVSDGGDLNIEGTIGTAGAIEGGLIELYAGGDIDLGTTSRIDAGSMTADARGTEVYLNADNGEIRFEQGAVIDVTGPAVDAGGIVYFRAQWEENRPKMDLQGSIEGAVQVIAEGVTDVSDQLPENRISSNNISNVFAPGTVFSIDSDTFAAAIAENPNFHFIPGFEINASGNFTVGGNIDLTSARYGWTYTNASDTQTASGGQEAGALTVRAAGNLDIDADIADKPALFGSQHSTRAITTWTIKLAAGADTDSADPLAVKTIEDGVTRNLTIADGALIYSQSAPLWFASGNDTLIGSGANVAGLISRNNIPANVMTYDKPIRGVAGGSLEIAGGAIQSALGDIHLTVNEDLTLNTVSVSSGVFFNTLLQGSIRTIGEPPAASSVPGFDPAEEYWNYANGGEIMLRVGGDITGKPSQQGWGERYLFVDGDFNSIDVWGPVYGGSAFLPQTHAIGSRGSITQGIATMGGGDLSVKADGRIYAMIGTFAEGDLEVTAGKNLDGRFLIRNGKGSLTALQDFGLRTRSNGNGNGGTTQSTALHSQLELFDAELSVVALGTVKIGSILNPGVISEEFADGYWNMGYGSQSKVKLTAVEGDVAYTGNSDFLNNVSFATSDKRDVLPPIFEVSAGKDILIEKPLYLAPSSSGQLILDAGNDINGNSFVGGGTVRSSAGILMSEVEPDEVFGFQEDEAAAKRKMRDPTLHTETPLHTGYDQAVAISAGWDIKNISFTLPKPSEIKAGRDIENFGILAQTLTPNDPNIVYAERDIKLQSAFSTGVVTVGIESAGPGGLIVQAGNNIDLGATEGIRTSGGISNPFLPAGDSPLLLAAGLAGPLLISEVLPLFEELTRAAEEFSIAKAQGELAEADQILTVARNEILPLLTSGEAGEGIINMTKSQVATTGSKGDLNIIANGEINVGKSAFSSGDDQNTGINAISGGGINVYVKGDLNVNESRIVSFGGGDIMAWSDQGDINAGRGSKAEISASAPRLVIIRDEETNEIISRTIVFEPPAVGSGIRALTFDPDGVAGPQKAPEPGDVFLIAPEGTIDAGEAGIAGKNIFLGAQQVLNVQNIEVGGASVGVPSSTNTGAIGITGDTGSLKQANELAAEAQDLAGKKQMEAAAAAQLAEALKLKWLKVDFVGYDERYDEEK